MDAPASSECDAQSAYAPASLTHSCVIRTPDVVAASGSDRYLGREAIDMWRGFGSFTNGLTVFLLLSTAEWSRAERILVWETAGSTSHMVVMDALVRALALRNHSITYVAYNEPSWAIDNVHFIEAGLDVASKVDSKAVFEGRRALNWSLRGDDPLEFQRRALDNPEIRSMLRGTSNSTFDLTIVTNVVSDLGLFLAKKRFSTPVVVLCAGFLLPQNDRAMGNEGNPSFVPTSVLLEVTSSMSFLQRVQNTLLRLTLLGIGDHVMMPRLNAELSKALDEDNVSEEVDVAFLMNNVDLMLVNTHPLFDQAKPIAPNTQLVGGMHIRREEELNQMDKELKDFLDQAHQGVVYVSFGSVMRSCELPIEKLEALLAVFESLKQRVLIKWEDDKLVNRSSNVKTGKWIPQQLVLSHKNVVAFVSHGGLLSLQESVYFGVPILIMPGFGDQFANGRIANGLGVGQTLHWSHVDQQSFGKSLRSVLTNGTMRLRASHMSKLFRDQLIHPLDKAVYYTEFVMRHGGAAHLHPASKNLNLLQYLLIDVILFLLTVLVVMVSVVYVIVNALLRRILAITSIKRVKVD